MARPVPSGNADDPEAGGATRAMSMQQGGCNGGHMGWLNHETYRWLWRFFMNVQSSTIGILYDFMGFIDDSNDGALWLNFLVEIPWDGDFLCFFLVKGLTSLNDGGWMVKWPIPGLTCLFLSPGIASHGPHFAWWKEPGVLSDSLGKDHPHGQWIDGTLW